MKTLFSVLHKWALHSCAHTVYIVGITECITFLDTHSLGCWYPRVHCIHVYTQSRLLVSQSALHFCIHTQSRLLVSECIAFMRTHSLDCWHPRVHYIHAYTHNLGCWYPRDQESRKPRFAVFQGGSDTPCAYRERSTLLCCVTG